MRRAFKLFRKWIWGNFWEDLKLLYKNNCKWKNLQNRHYNLYNNERWESLTTKQLFEKFLNNNYLTLKQLINNYHKLKNLTTKQLFEASQNKILNYSLIYNYFSKFIHPNIFANWSKSNIDFWKESLSPTINQDNRITDAILLIYKKSFINIFYSFDMNEYNFIFEDIQEKNIS